MTQTPTAPPTPAATAGPVLVVGAGLLGASIGLGLRHLGVDVWLQDSSPTAEAVAQVGHVLVEAVRNRRRLLVIEPIATRVSPWWDAWSTPFVAAGGRLDQWRFQAELPDVVRRLGRAAGLRSDWITARTLFV